MSSPETTKEQPYIGIDYGAGQANRDRETGIHYGVISQNSVNPESLEDIMTNGEDVAYKQAKADCVAVIQERVHHWFNDHSYLNRNEKKMRSEFRELVFAAAKNQLNTHTAERIADDTTENWGKTSTREELLQDAESAVDTYFGDSYESDGGLKDYRYDRDGYKLTGCLDNDLFVFKSPYYTYAQFCSPCVPGAGNLDHPVPPDAGAPKSYCLFHDWFDDEKAPYRIWRVGDDVEIVAVEETEPCSNCAGTGRDKLQRVADVREQTIEAMDKSSLVDINLADGTFRCFRCNGTKIQTQVHHRVAETCPTEKVDIRQSGDLPENPASPT